MFLVQSGGAAADSSELLVSLSTKISSELLEVSTAKLSRAAASRAL